MPSGKKPLNIWLTNIGFSPDLLQRQKPSAYGFYLIFFFPLPTDVENPTNLKEHSPLLLTVQLTAITMCCHAIKKTKIANMYKCNNILSDFFSRLSLLALIGSLFFFHSFWAKDTYYSKSVLKMQISHN